MTADDHAGDYRCHRCNQPSTSQGHYGTWCHVTGAPSAAHLCCPTSCELAGDPA